MTTDQGLQKRQKRPKVETNDGRSVYRARRYYSRPDRDSSLRTVVDRRGLAASALLRHLCCCGCCCCCWDGTRRDGGDHMLTAQTPRRNDEFIFSHTRDDDFLGTFCSDGQVAVVHTDNISDCGHVRCMRSQNRIPLCGSLCVCHKNHCHIQPLTWSTAPYYSIIAQCLKVVSGDAESPEKQHFTSSLIAYCCSWLRLHHFVNNSQTTTTTDHHMIGM